MDDLSSWSSGKVGERTTSPIWTLLSSSPSSSVLPSWRCWAIPSRRCHHCLPPSSCCSLAYFATAPAGEIIHILQIVFSASANSAICSSFNFQWERGSTLVSFSSSLYLAYQFLSADEPIMYYVSGWQNKLLPVFVLTASPFWAMSKNHSV